MQQRKHRYRLIRYCCRECLQPQTRTVLNRLTERQSQRSLQLCISSLDQGLNWGGGSHRISDPTPLVWDPLPLITDPVPHNWDSAPFCWDTPLCTVNMWEFFSMHDVLEICHLHLSMLGVDSCCKRQTLFKCQKSQTECLECSKTPGRRSGTPPLLWALRARALVPQASRL